MGENRYEKEKKKREGEEFDRFVLLMPDFPKGEVIHKDSPDFRIHTPNKIIGIELGQVDKESRDDRLIGSKARDIVEAAKYHSRAKSLPPVHVNLLFNQHSLERKIKQRSLSVSERDKIAESVAVLVAENIPSKDGPAFSVGLGEPDWNIYGDVIDRIDIFRNEEEVGTSWNFPLVHTTEEGKIERIQMAIDEKNEKYKKYLEACDECWLLLTTNSFNGLGTTVAVPDEAFGHCYDAPFSKVYFLDLFERKLVQLTIKA